MLNIYSYITNFRKPGDEPLGKTYPPNDKNWAKEILEYDSSDIMSPSIKEGKMCKFCYARLLPHESDGTCCNHGQVIETRLLKIVLMKCTILPIQLLKFRELQFSYKY